MFLKKKHLDSDLSAIINVTETSLDETADPLEELLLIKNKLKQLSKDVYSKSVSVSAFEVIHLCLKGLTSFKTNTCL